MSPRPKFIGYGAWERELRRRGWRNWRYFGLLAAVSGLLIWAGGWWPLFTVPVVLAIDYGWTCTRLAKRTPQVPQAR